MKIHKQYVVYELNRVMGSDKHLALEKIYFDSGQANVFDTEEDAIKALFYDKKTHQDYIILTRIYIN